MISSDKNPIRGQETALTFQFSTESFESALNIYVFICNECSDKIITQSAKNKMTLPQGRAVRDSLKGSYR